VSNQEDRSASEADALPSEPNVLEPVLISALEHWSYCPRQCALIHLEQTFDENIYTVQGHMLHERVDEEASELRGDVRIERAVPLWSRQLGLVGRADVVEFHGEVPFPVEYKVGRRSKWGHDDLQLCSQALCLEEMTEQMVPRGAIYHHGSRRRREVIFDDALRQRVVEAVADIRQMLAAGVLPPAVNDARCKHCSLIDSCLPSVIGEAGRVRALQASLFRVSELPG
jgi:CRISPR-associated exonuclease Cas4